MGRIEVMRLPLGIATLLLIALAGIRIYALGFSTVPISVPAHTTLVADWLFGFTRGNPYLHELFRLLLSFAGAFLLFRIGMRNMLLPFRSYVPSLIFVFLSYGSSAGGVEYLAVLLGVVLILYGCDLLAVAFSRIPRFSVSFTGSMMFGITPLLYPPLALLWILIPAAMRIYRRGWKETVTSLVGLLLPAGTYHYISWATGGGAHSMIEDSLHYIRSERFIAGWHAAPLYYGAIGLSVLIVLLSTIIFIRKRNDMRTRAFKVSSFLLVFIILTAAMAGLTGIIPAISPVWGAAASLFTVHLFLNIRGIIPAVLFWLMVLSVLATGITSALFNPAQLPA